MAAPTKAPANDPVVMQRALVYAVMGFISITGLTLCAALKDPCAGHPTMAGIATCHPTFKDHLPGMPPFVAMVLAFGAMVFFYEMRWYLRVYLVGAIGLALITVAALVFNAGMPKVLGVANLLFGLALLAAAYGLYRGQRGAWSFAVSAFGVLTVAFLFGSAKVASSTHVHLAWAVLPALAVFLPACVALATSAPGGAFYLPFARTPLKR